MHNGKVGVVVGDVTGHGVGPALLMAETRAYLRVLAGRRENPGEILTQANSVLAEDVGSERFITLFLGCIDPAARTFVYASAGHPPGFVLGVDGKVRATLKRTGIPLGMRPDNVFSTAPEIALASGDIVLLLTDGIEEASAPDDSLFGMERILETIRASRESSAQGILQALYEAVRLFSHRGPQLDDITAMVIKVR